MAGDVVEELDRRFLVGAGSVGGIAAVEVEADELLVLGGLAGGGEHAELDVGVLRLERRELIRAAGEHGRHARGEQLLRRLGSPAR
jgi:hypothetical protein